MNKPTKLEQVDGAPLHIPAPAPSSSSKIPNAFSNPHPYGYYLWQFQRSSSDILILRGVVLIKKGSQILLFDF